MPTINTASIEGFAEMSAEQKVEALLKMEVPEAVDLSGFIPKSQFDKTASELAEAKKSLKSKMSEDEAAAAERDAKWAEMEEKLAKLEQEKQESTYKASYLALGYEDELATDTAKAMVAGDMARVFENQKKAAQAAEKRLKAELLKDTPKPDGTGGDSGEDDSIRRARERGKERAASMSASNDALKHYL